MNLAMNNKQVSFLIAIGAISVSATSALGETNTPSQVIFSCEVNNGVPTTILKAGNTQKTIFNWQSELISSSLQSRDLCDNVADKLNTYSADENNDLSALTFKTDVLAENIPMICATDESSSCGTKLFTLGRTREPIKVANKVLDDILSEDLQTTKIVDNRRGLQSVSHSIDIWELILGRKFVKSF